MAVSEAVRRYYAERIFAKTGRDRAPPNFVPLEVPPTGHSEIEGCQGGGKNVLLVTLVGEDDRVTDVRMACGLCNPAMYAAADIVADWARGRPFAEIRALDVLDIDALAVFWERLGGPGRPDDAREKFQYALLAVQNAVRDHLGQAYAEPPPIPAPIDKDWDENDL